MHDRLNEVQRMRLFTWIKNFVREFFRDFWWADRMLWWWICWSRSSRILASLLLLASLVLLLLQRSAAALILFKFAFLLTAVIWIIPYIWGAYRLYTRIRHTVSAGWCRADADISKELRSDWMEQVRNLGFNLAGYLTKLQDNAPRLALFINSENRDSAHVCRVAGKDLLVFKTRFANGFAFETGNPTSAPLPPAVPNYPAFRFPQIGLPLDLYRVHQRIRSQKGPEHEPVISDDEGEIAEFVSRAEVVRRHMMSRDYRLDARANAYVFTVLGAIRRAVLLTWPAKPIRQAMFRRKALNELARLGFRVDKSTDRIIEQ